MEFDTLVYGAIVGFIVGGLLFTNTGRSVSRAAGERVAYHVRPKNGSRKRRR